MTLLSETLGWTLLHSLWQGLVIAAPLALILLAVRSAPVRYAAACCAMFAMLVSFVCTFIQLQPDDHGGNNPFLLTPASPASGWPGAAESIHTLTDFATFIPWLAPLWLLGVCLCYLHHAAAWLAVSRLRRTGVCPASATWQSTVTTLAHELKLSRPVVLLESILAEAPVVLGHVRPVILVPLGFLASLPPNQVEAILLHELAHIRRSDYLLNIAQRLIEGIFFYHPAVWWFSHIIRTERENCCDDLVISLRADPRSYALALTALERNRLETAAIAANGGNLMKRIHRLLYPKTPAGLWAPTLAAALFIVTGAIMLSAWQQTQTPDPWQKWLKEDVVYLITPQEKAAFERLHTNEERAHFVEQFWERHPTKEEHYRRIAFANHHFPYKAGHLPGWKTGRGRIYILYGPPDEIDSHPSGGRYERPAAEGGGAGNTYPFESWRYHLAAGKGNRDFEFIDPTDTGEFRLAANWKEKYK